MTQSYFTDRSVKLYFQEVCLEKSVTRGCPQGSVGGPSYWVIMYDSLLRLILPDDCNINTYADDALLMIYGNTIQNAETKCNECLRKIKEWGGKHGLSFNPNKTSAMLITNKLKFRDPVLTMDGTQIQLVNNF